MAVLANESADLGGEIGLSGWFGFGDLWCAEHGGEIASFAKLKVRLSRLEGWNESLKPEVLDLRKWTKWGGVVLLVGSAAVPIGFLVAPALAARLGALGLLGAASTGTQIVSLSGAALKSASLAYLGGGALATGGGGMALGTGVIGVATGYLATRVSAAVAYAYAKEVEDYDVIALRRGRASAVLFINGFLQQADVTFGDWLNGTRAHFSRHARYGVTWESGRLATLGQALFSDGAKLATAWVALRSGLSGLAKSIPAAKGLVVVEGLARILKGILANPWFVAHQKAAEVGYLNAEMLSRYSGSAPTLMGHSLGARTIYFTLLQLARKEGRPVVSDVFLFGGAVGSAEREWAKAATAVSGRIYNFYSTKDDVLSHLYQVVSLGRNRPIGLRRIRSRAPNIVNVPCTDLVDSHMDYKQKLELLLARAHRLAPW